MLLTNDPLEPSEPPQGWHWAPTFAAAAFFAAEVLVIAQGNNWILAIGFGLVFFLPMLVVCLFFAVTGASLASRGLPSSQFAPVFAVLADYVIDWAVGVSIMRTIGQLLTAWL